MDTERTIDRLQKQIYLLDLPCTQEAILQRTYAIEALGRLRDEVVRAARGGSQQGPAECNTR